MTKKIQDILLTMDGINGRGRGGEKQEIQNALKVTR